MPDLLTTAATEHAAGGKAKARADAIARGAALMRGERDPYLLSPDALMRAIRYVVRTTAACRGLSEHERDALTGEVAVAAMGARGENVVRAGDARGAAERIARGTGTRSLDRLILDALKGGQGWRDTAATYVRAARAERAESAYVRPDTIGADLTHEGTADLLSVAAGELAADTGTDRYPLPADLTAAMDAYLDTATGAERLRTLTDGQRRRVRIALMAGYAAATGTAYTVPGMSVTAAAARASEGAAILRGAYPIPADLRADIRAAVADLDTANRADRAADRGQTPRHADPDEERAFRRRLSRAADLIAAAGADATPAPRPVPALTPADRGDGAPAPAPRAPAAPTRCVQATPAAPAGPVRGPRARPMARGMAAAYVLGNGSGGVTDRDRAAAAASMAAYAMAGQRTDARTLTAYLLRMELTGRL